MCHHFACWCKQILLALEKTVIFKVTSCKTNQNSTLYLAPAGYKMRVIGLTGGIASGKTLATDAFKSLGVPIIDADCIAKSLMETNPSLKQLIIDHFGETITNDQNTINRQALANIIFSQPNERLWLNQLLHPMIRKSMIEQIDIAKKSNSSPYCLCVIPDRKSVV